MRNVLRGARGLAGLVLVFVIAWALAAVVLLTGTLVAAHQISRDVGHINPSLSGINANTKQIQLAQTTKALTGRIRAAAQPLSGELAGTLTAAQQIQKTADSILSRAESINGIAGKIHSNVFAIASTVGSISTNVASIGSTVNSIGSNVASIGSTVNGIAANVNAISASADGINASVHGIQRHAASVLADVRSIHGSVVPILGSARTINGTLKAVRGRAGSILTTVRVARVGTPGQDDGVVGINHRAVKVQGVIGPPAGPGIAGDLASVLTGVGSIDKNANAIDCSTLLNLSLLTINGPTMNCNKG
ncbi:MAG: hypothetical protein ACR2IP_10870 [Solirubrobacteraceae bacterium]